MKDIIEKNINLSVNKCFITKPVEKLATVDCFD